MLIKKSSLFMVASLFTLSSFAAPTSLDCKANKIGIEDNLKELANVSRKIASEGCPNSRGMKDLCSYIATASPDIDPNSNYQYYYQRVVYEASCVDWVNESEEDIARKVRAMWAKYGKDLRCPTMHGPGHPIKYAAGRLFHDFVTEAVQLWGLDLNVIDEAGGTVLDFIEIEIKRTSGSSQRNMKEYYELMRKAGAKHRREL
jgi:hypothetical protein